MVLTFATSLCFIDCILTTFFNCVALWFFFVFCMSAYFANKLAFSSLAVSSAGLCRYASQDYSLRGKILTRRLFNAKPLWILPSPLMLLFLDWLEGRGSYRWRIGRARESCRRKRHRRSELFRRTTVQRLRPRQWRVDDRLCPILRRWMVVQTLPLRQPQRQVSLHYLTFLRPSNCPRPNLLLLHFRKL